MQRKTSVAAAALALAACGGSKAAELELVESAAEPNDIRGMYQDARIEALQRRGLAVLPNRRER